MREHWTEKISVTKPVGCISGQVLGMRSIETIIKPTPSLGDETGG